MTAIFDSMPAIILIIGNSPTITSTSKLDLTKIPLKKVILEVDDINLLEDAFKKYVIIDLIVFDLDVINDFVINKIGVIKKLRPQVPLVVMSDLPLIILESFCLTVRAECCLQKSMPVDVVTAHLLKFLSLNSINEYPLSGSVKLSERQMEIVRLIDQGFSNADIAVELCIEVVSVKTHLVRIFRLLNAKNRSEAVFLARQKRFLNAI